MTPRRAEHVALGLMVSGAFFALAILFFIIAVIMIKGLPHITARFLLDNPMDMGRAGGIFSTIVSTVYLLVVSLVIAIPLGVGTAIYLTEYTEEGKITKIVRFGTECLAGVPSIILGLFGFILFVIKLGFGWSVLSGGISLAIMILPVIIRTSEEA
ncbi:MAG: phosphate ABC transporter, permease protein PstA, partial [Deltaproteobacteria bacterium]